MWYHLVCVSLKEPAFFYWSLFTYFVQLRSLGATWIPYPIRVHVSWICLAVVGSLTFYTSTRLHPQDYDLAKFIPAEDEVEEQPENEEQLNHRA